MKVFYVSLLKPLYIWSVFSFDFLESLTTATGLTDWLKWRGQPSVIKFFEVFKPFDQLINRLFEHKNVFECKSSDNQDYKGVYPDRFPSLIVSYCAYSKAKDMVVEGYCYSHFSKILLKYIRNSRVHCIHLALCTKQWDLSESLYYSLSIIESVGKIHFTNKMFRQTSQSTLHSGQISECAV